MNYLPLKPPAPVYPRRVVWPGGEEKPATPALCYALARQLAEQHGWAAVEWLNGRGQWVRYLTVNRKTQ